MNERANYLNELISDLITFMEENEQFGNFMRDEISIVLRGAEKKLLSAYDCITFEKAAQYIIEAAEKLKNGNGIICP